MTPTSGRSDRCVECGRELDVAAMGWRAYLLEGDDQESEIVLYCPACAYKEFGPPRKRSANDELPPN